MQPGVGYRFISSSSGITLDIGDPWPTNETVAFECSPYKVHDVYEVTEGESTYLTFEICPGTFNNLVPQVYDSVNEEWQYLNSLAGDAELLLDFNGTSSSYIYLRVGPDGGNFPPSSPAGGNNDPYPRIYSTGSTLPTDDNDFGYILLAQVTNTSGVYSITQYVTGSLWGDRVKLGTLTAKYYYARI